MIETNIRQFIEIARLHLLGMLPQRAGTMACQVR